MIFALFFIAWAANGIMDALQFHYSNSGVFPEKGEKLFGLPYEWWSPEESWENKYKNGDPEQGPAFIGSTTWLVGFTDAWHFFKLIMSNTLVFSLAIVADDIIGFVVINEFINFLSLVMAFKLIQWSAFWLTYKKIFA